MLLSQAKPPLITRAKALIPLVDTISGPTSDALLSQGLQSWGPAIDSVSEILLSDLADCGITPSSNEMFCVYAVERVPAETNKISGMHLTEWHDNGQLAGAHLNSNTPVEIIVWTPFPSSAKSQASHR